MLIYKTIESDAIIYKFLESIYPECEISAQLSIELIQPKILPAFEKRNYCCRTDGSKKFLDLFCQNGLFFLNKKLLNDNILTNIHDKEIGVLKNDKNFKLNLKIVIHNQILFHKILDSYLL